MRKLNHVRRGKQIKAMIKRKGGHPTHFRFDEDIVDDFFIPSGLISCLHEHDEGIAKALFSFELGTIPVPGSTPFYDLFESIVNYIAVIRLHEYRKYRVLDNGH